jgi:hypothetical protein
MVFCDIGTSVLKGSGLAAQFGGDAIAPPTQGYVQAIRD